MRDQESTSVAKAIIKPTSKQNKEKKEKNNTDEPTPVLTVSSTSKYSAVSRTDASMHGPIELQTTLASSYSNDL